MPDITSDQLRDISVKTVEMFLNDKVPLSEGLAKQASLHELNSEQIQRAVEAANSICYLKIIKVAEDRTIEFPLCKTAEVMAHISVPSSSDHSYTDTQIEKVAAFEKTEVGYSLTPNEQFIMLTKLAAENSMKLETAEGELLVVEHILYKKAELLATDPRAQAKLSHVGVSLEKVAEITEQVSGSFIFKEADLKLTKEVVALTKRAEELREDIAHRAELQKSAELAKKALSLNPLNWAGRAIGATVSAPFKMLGRGLKNTVQGVGHKIAPGSISKPTGKGIGKVLAAGSVAASVGFDSIMYNPKPASDINFQMKHTGPY